VCKVTLPLELKGPLLKELPVSVNNINNRKRMQTFLDKAGADSGIVLNTNVLGVATKRASKRLTKLEDKIVVKGQLPKHKHAGRPVKYEWDCRFCHKNCGTEGLLAKHWKETHHSGKTKSRFAKRDGLYYCKVKDCKTFADTDNRWVMRRHLDDEAAHGVEALLDAGIEAWQYRKVAGEVQEAILTWLFKKGYVADSYQQEDETLHIMQPSGQKEVEAEQGRN